MSYVVFKKGENNFRINFVAKDSDGNYIDLTGSTPWFYIGKHSSSTPIYSGQCTLGAYPKSGQCYIMLPSSATNTVGVFHGELVINYSTLSQKIIAQELTVVVLPSL